MAILRYAGDRYSGTSGDTKPTNALSGALFIETDTGDSYYYDGTSWSQTTIGLTSVTTDTTLTGDGTSGDALGVDLSHNFDWGGVHEFSSGNLRLVESLSGNDARFSFNSLSSGVVWTMPVESGNIPIIVSAGDSSVGAVRYNGTTRASGRFYGGTTTPTNSDRLNYDGYFYATAFSAGDADSTLQKTSGWIGLGRGVGGAANFYADDTECSAGVPFNAFSSARLLAGRITNTQTGGFHNWNPTGLFDASWIVWSGSNDVEITGIAGGVDGRILVITNASDLDNMFFYHDNTGSTAANRLLLPNESSAQLSPDTKAKPNKTAIFAYDGGASRWRWLMST